MCLHITFFAHLVISRPIKEKFDLFVQIYFELCVIGVTCCVIGIAAVPGSSNFESQSQQSLWTNLGQGLVVFNYMIVGGGLLVTTISLIQTACLIYQLFKRWLERRKLRKFARIRQISSSSNSRVDINVINIDVEMTKNAQPSQLQSVT